MQLPMYWAHSASVRAVRATSIRNSVPGSVAPSAASSGGGTGKPPVSASATAASASSPSTSSVQVRHLLGGCAPNETSCAAPATAEPIESVPGTTGSSPAGTGATST